MSGDQSHITISKDDFIINTNEKLPSNNGERCSVKVKYLECDAVLTLLDKKDGGESDESDENLFSLSINNYDNKIINGNMRSSLENYKNVIYYNSQLKKFYSSYNDEKDKETVKKNISHILILGKTDTSSKSVGSYILNIDKTILIYEASHANIDSAKESTPDLTMYEYFNLIYIDWFSLLLTDFENEFEKFKSVMTQKALSAQTASTEADSESEADSEAEFDLKEGEGEGGAKVVEGVGGEEEGEIKKEEGEIKKGEGGAEEGDPQSQRDTIAATGLQAAVRTKLAANKEERRGMLLKRYNDEEEERKEAIITQKLKNRGNIIMENGRGASSIGGKKKGKKTKKLN